MSCLQQPPEESSNQKIPKDEPVAKFRPPVELVCYPVAQVSTSIKVSSSRFSFESYLSACCCNRLGYS